MHTEHDKISVKIKSTNKKIKAKVSNNINIVGRVSTTPARVVEKVVLLEYIDGGLF
jgi:hypothetical protein